MKYNLQTLKNGLKVVTIPISGIRSVTVLLLVGVGSCFEEKRLNGISHFLEHMAFKGTKKRPSALSISTLIDSIGGEFNAFTGKNHTGYYIKAASKHLPLLLDVLSDMLLNSLFKKEEIEKEKGVIIEEINMYEDTPVKKISDLFENLLYGNTPLGRDISGSKEVIRSLKRDDFLSFIDKFYRPANSVVTIAGKTSSKIINLVNKHLGNWRENEVINPESVDDNQDRPQLLLKHKKTEQAHLSLGVRAYYLTHSSRYILSVLTALLGGGMSSRLFSEVREKRGLAYYITADTARYKDVGNFVVQAGVDVWRIEDAIKVILAEFQKIKEREITQEELKKVKEYIKGKLTLGLEDSKTIASLYATSLLLEGKVRTPKKIMEEIDKVNIQDVKKVAQDIFQEKKLNLAIIGPYKDEAKFRDLLRLN